MNRNHVIRHTFINRLQTLTLLLFIGGYLALLRTHPPTEERVRRPPELKQPIERPDPNMFFTPEAPLFRVNNWGRSIPVPRRHLSGLWY